MYFNLKLQLINFSALSVKPKKDFKKPWHHYRNPRDFFPPNVTKKEEIFLKKSSKYKENKKKIHLIRTVLVSRIKIGCRQINPRDYLQLMGNENKSN